MAEQLSEGAQTWYNQARHARRLNELFSANKVHSPSPWVILFDELKIAKTATDRTFLLKKIPAHEYRKIRTMIDRGVSLLSGLHKQYGDTINPDKFNTITMDTQTKTFEPLHRFLHPEEAAKIAELRSTNA